MAFSYLSVKAVPKATLNDNVTYCVKILACL